VIPNREHLMTAFSKPLWDSGIGGLLVRIPIGIYFFMAGRMKLENVGGFVDTVQNFNILPEDLAVLFGVMVPWVETIIGIFLVLGLWTTAISMVTGALLISYIVALGLNPVSPSLFNKDVMILGAVLSLAASGAGALSVDKFRRV
jgi:uncharacterized membrane protein YphA (DoxX/SURF4 family)